MTAQGTLCLIIPSLTTQNVKVARIQSSYTIKDDNAPEWGSHMTGKIKALLAAVAELIRFLVCKRPG